MTLRQAGDAAALQRYAHRVAANFERRDGIDLCEGDAARVPDPGGQRHAQPPNQPVAVSASAWPAARPTGR